MPMFSEKFDLASIGAYEYFFENKDSRLSKVNFYTPKTFVYFTDRNFGAAEGSKIMRTMFSAAREIAFNPEELSASRIQSDKIVIFKTYPYFSLEGELLFRKVRVGVFP